jgi:regulator of protease activity HflC (stomatin/prohibitin superfamily)
MGIGLIILIVVLVLLAIIMLAKSIVVVRQAQKVIVERFGRFKEVLDPGLRFLLPFVDSVRSRVDMRETVIDIEPQQVITNDNVTVSVDAIVYYYVTDAKAVTYEVANFFMAVTKLAQTNLRNLIGEMSLDATLTSRERINASLRTTLDEATDKWGVKVTRVEVKEIQPPRDITDAMSKQMKAEREKRATILEAEAFRQKQILEAEGTKQHEILLAEGDKQAAILRAEGEAKAIEAVSTAADRYFVGNAQLLKQLQVAQASLENNSKLVISDQSRLVNVLGLTEALSGHSQPPKPKQ